MLKSLQDFLQARETSRISHVLPNRAFGKAAHKFQLLACLQRACSGRLMPPNDPFNFRDLVDPLLRGFLTVFDCLELLSGLLEVLLNW